jgi:hypothetical protein
MISGTSLSAFSASIAQTRAGQTASVQGARPVSGGAPSSFTAQPFIAPKAGPASQDSTRPPPRGSLLDLSV